MSSASAVTTIAPTVVSADRLDKAETSSEVVYGRGKFAQHLDKVKTDPSVEAALAKSKKLVQKDTTLDTLVAASAVQPGAATQGPTGTVAQIQQKLQNGAAAIKQATRTSLGMHYKI